MVENNTSQDVTSEVLLVCSFDNCTEENVHKCKKCDRAFCVMHANIFSPNFCQDCFKGLSSVEEKFHRVFDDYDTKTQKVVTIKQTNTRYYMDGPDWPFLNIWIHQLSEEQLRTLWIFHHSVMRLIEAENEVRKVRKAKKLREEQLANPVMTTTTVKKDRTVKVTKAVDSAEDVRKKLKKQGLPDAVIEQMVKMLGAV